MNSIIKKPNAWLPIAMSLAALTLVLGYLSIYGIRHEPQADEGTAAHLFQLLIAGQIPIIAFFGIKWISGMPKQALLGLAIQILSAIIPFALVFFPRIIISY